MFALFSPSCSARSLSLMPSPPCSLSLLPSLLRSFVRTLRPCLELPSPALPHQIVTWLLLPAFGLDASALSWLFLSPSPSDPDLVGRCRGRSGSGRSGSTMWPLTAIEPISANNVRVMASWRAIERTSRPAPVYIQRIAEQGYRFVQQGKVSSESRPRVLSQGPAQLLEQQDMPWDRCNSGAAHSQQYKMRW